MKGDDVREASGAVEHGTPVATSRISEILNRIQDHPETQQRIQELKAKDNARDRLYIKS